MLGGSTRGGGACPPSANGGTTESGSGSSRETESNDSGDGAPEKPPRAPISWAPVGRVTKQPSFKAAA